MKIINPKIYTIMKKMNLIELAIKGMDINTIAENLGNLGVELWQAERIINGIPEIDMKKLKAKVAQEKGREYVSHSMINALQHEECIYVNYRFQRTVYWNKEYQMPEGVECVDREEYSKMYRNADYTSNQRDGYPYKMVFWETSTMSVAPEIVAL